MALRIVDAEAQLDQAFEQLAKTLADWAGGKGQPWQKNDREGVREEGCSYARRDDVHLYTEKTPKTHTVGVALTEKDRVLVTIEIPRHEPAKERKRFAVALGDHDEPYVLVSVDELRRQDLRDPFKRLAGAPQIKRANVSDRDYVMIGPLNDGRAAEALLSLAALNPRFEDHVEKLAALAGGVDKRDEADIYRVSVHVAHEPKVHTKVVEALFTRLRGAGFQVAELKNGALSADFAVARSDMAIAFEIRSDAEIGDLLKAMGRLTVVAPAGGAFKRCVVLPAPRDGLAATLASFEPALHELGVFVLFYDFQEHAFGPRTVKFSAPIAPADFPPDLHKVFE